MGTEEENKTVSKLDSSLVSELCDDYAKYTRSNISEEHVQILTQIAAIEEQLSSFSDILSDIQGNNEILKVMLPKITAQYESLRPNFRKIDRMEDLVTRVSADFDVLGSKLILKSTKLPTGSEKQLDDAENTIVEGTLRNVLKMSLNLLNKQLSVTEVLQMFTTFTYNLNLKYFHLCK